MVNYWECIMCVNVASITLGHEQSREIRLSCMMSRAECWCVRCHVCPVHSWSLPVNRAL